METVPVLFDTDIGTNVDDALALLYLLRQPRCELLGVTTVSSDVRKRAACAEFMCGAAGRDDVPIHCGSPGPILLGMGQPGVPLYEAVAHREHATDRPIGTAVEFMRHAIRRRPGEVMLLTTGPLTNVALLFATDPEIPALLKGIVSMAGVYFAHERPVETNVKADPVAAAMMFRATGVGAHSAPHVLVGLTVTTRCVASVDDVRERLRPPLPPADVVLEMLDAWSRRSRQIVFHDALAAVLVFDPPLCTYEEGVVMVDVTRPGEEAARTFFAPAKSLPGAADGQRRSFRQSVAKGVKVNPFFDAYFATVSDTAVAPAPGRYLPPPPDL